VWADGLDNKQVPTPGRYECVSGLFGHGAMPNVPGDDEQFAGVEGQAQPEPTTLSV
jgi:hypothetical protein